MTNDAVQSSKYEQYWRHVHSNVKPKFFTDFLKGILALPIVIEVGRLWRCLVLLEVTSMSSVLLSFSLSMFAVAQALTSLIHDCIEWSSSDIPSGGADICNCMSSANEWCMIECVSIHSWDTVANPTHSFYVIFVRCFMCMVNFSSMIVLIRICQDDKFLSCRCCQNYSLQ